MPRGTIDLDYTAHGLKPGGSYEASVSWVGRDGKGANVGLSAQTADTMGRIVFSLVSVLPGALGSSPAPGTMTAWARKAGTSFDTQIPGTVTAVQLI